MDSHLILGAASMLVSGVGIYVGLTVRVAVSKLETQLIQLRLDLTIQQRDREQNLREWAERTFVAHRSTH